MTPQDVADNALAAARRAQREAETMAEFIERGARTPHAEQAKTWAAVALAWDAALAAAVTAYHEGESDFGLRDLT